MADSTGERQTDSESTARADARAQVDTSSGFMPHAPASTSPFAPEGTDPSRLAWAATVARGYSHRVLARGTRIGFDE